MPSLAETQRQVRAAIVADHAVDLPVLVGGSDPSQRLAIHRRHYRSSLVAALLTKFPATAWLMGEAFVTAAAQAYTRRRPPGTPCIAEYGDDFAGFLAGQPEAARTLYLQDFATLEWHVGHVSVAISRPPADLGVLSECDPAALPGVILRLQPGLRYMAASWPVDDLIALYLRDDAPDRFEMNAAAACVELHGARGEFRISRLDTATFVFRRAILDGHAIGAAAELAGAEDADFDPGCALGSLAAQNLVIAAVIPSERTS